MPTHSRSLTLQGPNEGTILAVASNVHGMNQAITNHQVSTLIKAFIQPDRTLTVVCGLAYSQSPPIRIPWQ
jgi:hypothetical protein